MKRLTNKEFNEYVHHRLEELMAMGKKKGSEYAPNGHRLNNFHHGASKRRTIPEDYCLGLVTKHEVALEDFIEELKRGRMMPLDSWLEKTGDVIVYMLCLEGLIIERIQNGAFLVEGEKVKS